MDDEHPSDREFLIWEAYGALASAACPPWIERTPEIAQETKETVVTSTAERQRQQAHADHNDILNAIVTMIHEARQEGKKTKVFPRYLYLNTRVWEDEVAPGNVELLKTMQIEVRHSPLMPIDRFSLTFDPYPVDEVANHLRQYDALPKQA